MRFEITIEQGLAWVPDGKTRLRTATPGECAEEIERLRKALHEITIRTEPYRERWDEWPLVAGIDDTARKALNNVRG